MAIVAGIDEAGFGPIMGPLVVSASVFDVPDELADKCLWRCLSSAVTKKNFRKSPLLPVADSKALHVRTDGLVHIERGMLGMLSQMGHRPSGLRELLGVVAEQIVPDLEKYPWYAGRDLALPRAAGATDIALRANGLSQALGRRGISLLAMRAEPILTAEFNRLVTASDNKATSLLDVVCRLIWRVMHMRTDQPRVRIAVDHLGGRVRYLTALQRLFEGAAIKIVEESDNCSAYIVDYEGRRLELSFRVEGESNSLATALASMISKYLRELFMEMENDFWCGLMEGLKPTAGYYGDGTRFIREITPLAQARNIHPNLFTRLR